MDSSDDHNQNLAYKQDSPQPKWYYPATEFGWWIGRGVKKILHVLNYASPALTAIATGLLAWVALLQWQILSKTDETLNIQQRAWLTPLQANLVQTPSIPPVRKGEPIEFNVAFTNNGREPARGVKLRILNATIDGYDPKNTDVATLAVPENTACSNLEPEIGHAVIGPTGEQTARAISYASIFGEPYFVANNALVNGSKFYVANGCAAYLTQGKVRHTSFCYILKSQIAQIPAQGANAARDERIWYFVTCARGFDAN